MEGLWANFQGRGCPCADCSKAPRPEAECIKDTFLGGWGCPCKTCSAPAPSSVASIKSESKLATRKRKASVSEDKGQKKAKIDQVPSSGKCPWPGCAFVAKDHLERHYKVHTSERLFVCDWDSCGKRFTLKHNLVTHVRRHKSALFKCEIGGCRRSFASKLDCEQHRITHAPGPFTCSHTGCGKLFKEKGNLTKHEAIHIQPRRFVCVFDRCGKKFNNVDHLRVHTRFHTGHRPFHCVVTGCSKSFHTSSGLADHTNSHTNNRRFECTWTGCNKRFIVKSALDGHVRVHTGERPFVCAADGCGYKAAQAWTLKTHVAAVHTSEGSGRRKKKEDRYFKALKDIGEVVDRREFHHDFSRFGQTFARSDGLSQKDGFKVLHELQEHQHKFYPIRGDPDRAIRIYASMRAKKDTEPFIIANVNPDAMKVNGVLFKVPYSKRVAWVVKYINDFDLKFNWPVIMAYFWYDQTDGIPDVWRHPDFPKSMLHLCVNATPIIPDESADKFKTSAQKDSES